MLVGVVSGAIVTISYIIRQILARGQLIVYFLSDFLFIIAAYKTRLYVFNDFYKESSDE